MSIFVKMLSGDLLSFEKENVHNIEILLNKIKSSLSEEYPLWRLSLFELEKDYYSLFIKDNYINITTEEYDTIVADSRGNRYKKMDIILKYQSNDSNNKYNEIYRLTVYFDYKENSFINSKDTKVKVRENKSVSIEILVYPKIEYRKSLLEIIQTVPSDIIPNLSDYHFI
jgi:hypothetical protein